jgi:hypothetical protein
VTRKNESTHPTAAWWNHHYPAGTPVLAYPLVRPDDPCAADLCERLETRTRSQAWNLGHGEPVVLVEDYAGGIALTHAAPATNGATT